LGSADGVLNPDGQIVNGEICRPDVGIGAGGFINQQPGIIKFQADEAGGGGQLDLRPIDARNGLNIQRRGGRI